MSPRKDKPLKAIAEIRAEGHIHVAEVVEKMCDVVGAPLKVVNSHGRWYMDYAWTEAEQLEFEEWMAAYLKNDKKAMREFSGCYMRHTLKECKRVAHQFAMWYGWRTRIPDDTETK